MFVVAAILGIATIPAQREVYVSPEGSDRNAGTAQKPMATLDGARDRARATKCHLILVKAGEYRLTHSLTLDSHDDGLLIQPVKGARPKLLGGVPIPPSSVKPCSDQAILARIIEPPLRGTVKWVDLRRLGLGSVGPIQPRGFSQPPRPAPTELFADGSPMTLARWPNKGYTKVGTVTEPGNGEQDQDKPKRKPIFVGVEDRARFWTKAGEPWLYGYWKFDWADESIKVDSIDPATGSITLANPHVYGVDKGTPFFAENLIEELDRPGEYWIDRKSLRLYFIPPAGPLHRFELSILDQPLITISGAKNVTIRGIDLGMSRGDGVVVKDCESTRVEGCRLFGLGGRGAVIESGQNCGLQSSDVWATGEGGITLSGGDRSTLKPAHNFVDNCDIHDYERRSQTYRPAVLISGVGNRVSHCAMHDAPHSAIIFSGNDHIIEANEFYRTISATGDGGVVYTGRDWTARGTEISNNYFHDNIGQSKWEPAIYVDDLGSGIVAKGNVIERCHWGFLIGGGRDNILEDNTIIDCHLAFDCDARGLGWGKSMLPTLTERLKAVPYLQEPWRSRYPALVPILDHEPLAPSGNVLRGNLLVRSGNVTQRMEEAFKSSARIEANMESSTLPKERKLFPNGRAGLHSDALRTSLGR